MKNKTLEDYPWFCPEPFTNTMTAVGGLTKPCCFIDTKSWRGQSLDNFRKEFLGDQKFYDDYYHNTSNNLLEKNLEEIMNDVFYDVLQLSWEDKSTCLKPCSNTCSFSKDATRESARTSNYRVYVW